MSRTVEARATWSPEDVTVAEGVAAMSATRLTPERWRLAGRAASACVLVLQLHDFAGWSVEGEGATKLEPEPVTGRLRVAIPSDLAILLLSDAIAAFVALHPAVTLELDLSPRRADLLGENLDLAVQVGFPPEDALLAVRRVVVGERARRIGRMRGWGVRLGGGPRRLCPGDGDGEAQGHHDSREQPTAPALPWPALSHP